MKLSKQLKNKKILLLSVKTFNYEHIIAEQLRSHGAEVDYYDERPSNSIIVKGLIRLKREVYQRTINNYYKRILLNSFSKQYDYLFVIRGEVVPSFFLQQFKNQQPNCTLIFYTWDSFSNNPHPEKNLEYYHKAFTFDSSDAKIHNIGFRPLFYHNSYSEIRQLQDKTYEYDLLFIGTAHSDRYKIGNTLIQWCADNSLSSFAYYYIQSRAVYFYKKWFDPTFKEFEFNKLSFQSLTIHETLSLYKQSKIILDINHPGQKGLTMRTFETLAAGRKLITTNPEVKKYPFYSSNNIFIIDRDKPEVQLDFFTTKFEAISKELLFRMSIDGWLESLFFSDGVECWIEN